MDVEDAVDDADACSPGEHVGGDASAGMGNGVNGSAAGSKAAGKRGNIGMLDACTIGRCVTRKARKRPRLAEASDDEDEEEEDQSEASSTSDEIDSPWPRLARWEATNEPAKLRRQAYEKCIERCHEVFQRVLQEVYQPLLEDVKDILQECSEPSREGLQDTAYLPHSLLYGSGRLKSSFQDPSVSSSNKDDGTSGLHCSLLTGPEPDDYLFTSISHTLAERSLASAKSSSNSGVVLRINLQASEIGTLPSALRLVLSRLSAEITTLLRQSLASRETQANSPDDPAEEASTLAQAASAGDPLALQQLLQLFIDHLPSRAGEERTHVVLCVLVSSLSTADQQTLADILSVLLKVLNGTLLPPGNIVDPKTALSKTGRQGNSHGKLLFMGYVPDRATWQESFPFNVLRLMEIEQLATPDRSVLFEKIIEELFLASPTDPNQDVRMVGPSFEALQLLRQIFEQSNGNLSRLSQTLEILYQSFLENEPLSTLCCSGADVIDLTAWTDDYKNMLRMQLSRDAEFILDGILSERHKEQIEQEWLTGLSDTSYAGQAALLEKMVDFASATMSFAHCTAQTARMLSAGLSKVMARRRIDDTPSREQKAPWWGALNFLTAAIDKTTEPFTNLLKKVQQEIDTATLEELTAMVQEWLDQLEQWNFDFGLIPATFALRKPSIVPLVGAPINVLKKGPSILADSLDTLTVLCTTTEQNGRAQLHDEAEVRTDVKDVVKDIMEFCFVDPSTMLPLANKFALGPDAVERARSILCSTPRHNLQLSLEAPELIFASHLRSNSEAQDTFLTSRSAELENAARLHIVPDLARAYGLWRERGSARLINLADWYSVFKMTSVKGTNQESDQDEQANQGIQARFAGSLFQLATMGFIRSTKRKADHVAKTVFDLPVIADPLAE